jgi:hypothetical protein
MLIATFATQQIFQLWSVCSCWRSQSSDVAVIHGEECFRHPRRSTQLNHPNNEAQPHESVQNAKFNQVPSKEDMATKHRPDRVTISGIIYASFGIVLLGIAAFVFPFLSLYTMLFVIIGLAFFYIAYGIFIGAWWAYYLVIYMLPPILAHDEIKDYFDGSGASSGD